MKNRKATKNMRPVLATGVEKRVSLLERKLEAYQKDMLVIIGAMFTRRDKLLKLMHKIESGNIKVSFELDTESDLWD